MDITERTFNALATRDQTIKNWRSSSTAMSQNKNEKDYKIQFSNGSMLLAAVTADDADEMARLLKEGADVNFANADGLTSLHQACIDESLETIKLLCSYGANVNAKDNEGWTPLHAVAGTDMVEIIKYLVTMGADLSAVNTDGELPVDLTDDPKVKNFMMKSMRDNKINLDNARNMEHTIMLEDVSNCVAQGKYELVRNKQGATTLHIAACKSYMDILELLVENLKVDINVRDYDGWTPLHAAVYWKQVDVVSYLIDYGADYMAKTDVGLLPIDLAMDDMIYTLKNIIKKKCPSANLGFKNVDKSSEVNFTHDYPHNFKSAPSSILKKTQKLSKISLPPPKAKLNNSPTPKLPKTPSTSRSSHSDDSYASKPTERSTSIKLPPRPTSEHKSTPQKVVDISDTENVENGKSATEKVTATAAIVQSPKRPPPSHNNKIARPPPISSISNEKNENEVTILKNKLEESLKQVNSLQDQLVKTLKEKDDLSVKLNLLTLNKSTSASNDQNRDDIEKLIKENKRLASENATLIKAMSIYGRTRPQGDNKH